MRTSGLKTHNRQKNPPLYFLLTINVTHLEIGKPHYTKGGLTYFSLNYPGTAREKSWPPEYFTHTSSYIMTKLTRYRQLAANKHGRLVQCDITVPHDTKMQLISLCCSDMYPPRCRTPYKMKLMRSLKSCGWKVLLGALLMWWRMAIEISLISG